MFEELNAHRQAVAENIKKAFDEDIEKSHQDGDIHPKHPDWVWVSSANRGKGDWRVIKKDKVNFKFKVGDNVKIKDSVNMASLSQYQDKDLKIIEANEVKMASGTNKQYVFLNEKGRRIEVWEDMIESSGDTKKKKLEDAVKEAQRIYEREGGSRYLSNLDYAKQKLADFKRKSGI